MVLVALVAIAPMMIGNAGASSPSGYTVSVFAGTGSYGIPTPGPATSSNLSYLAGVAVDSLGNVYIADAHQNRIEKVTPDGVLSIVAGTGSFARPTPGPALESGFYNPTGIAVDTTGNLFVADSGNGVIAKITPSGILSIYAGTGYPGYPTPGLAIASSLLYPTSVAVDSAGNVYVTDYRRVLKISPDGILSFVAGTGAGGFPSAGSALGSDLGHATGVATDLNGNLFIVDSHNHVVLKVTQGGSLSIFAGTFAPGTPTAGPASNSKLYNPSSVAVDKFGNVYVIDTMWNLVEKITPDGYLSVIAGRGAQGAPTPGPATNSSFWFPNHFGFPNGIAVDTDGNVYLGDTSNLRVEKLSPPLTAPFSPSDVSVTPGNGNATLDFTLPFNGGSEITKYQYRIGNGEWTDASGTTSPITVTGLTNYTTYRIRLRAVNAVGAGSTSSPVAVMPRIPGPSITSAKAQGSSRISATFSALTPAGGTTRHYWVYAYAKGTSTVLSSCRSSASARACVLAGLTGGSEYDIAVRGFFTLTGSPDVRPTLDSTRQAVRTRSQVPE